MTADKGILQEVCAEPENDVPRLVYADWLEEQGGADQALAEFIRLQLALARDREDSPQRREQAFRARTLLDENRTRWLEPFARFGLSEVQFVRGFVDRVTLLPADLELHGSALFATLPIRRLWIPEVYGDIQDDYFPPNNRLAVLDLSGDMIDADALRALSGMESLTVLRELALLFNEIDDEAARVLIEGSFFQRLSRIHLAGNPLTEEARDELQEHFGARVTFEARRAEDHLYNIQNDRFVTGFGRGHVQILLYGNHEQTYLVLFDHEGNFLSAQTRAVPPTERPAGVWQDLSMDTRREWLRHRDELEWADRKAWLDEHGYLPGTIQVKEFRFGANAGIHAFPEGWTRILERPGHDEREQGLNWIGQWLDRGKFAYVFESGMDWWLDAAGDVTDT